MISKVENAVGDVLKVDISKHTYKYMRFARMQVGVALDIMLKPSLGVHRVNLSPIWVDVRYEKIHFNCFACDLIMHTSHSCCAGDVKN